MVSFSSMVKAITATFKGCILACAVSLCLCVTSAVAGTELSQVGFVDIPYLIDKAPQAIEAEERLEAEFAPRQAELERQRAELNKISNQLLDVSLDLNNSQRSLLDVKARSLERRIKRSEQDFREELNIQKNNEFKRVRVLVLEAIAKFGKQNAYDLIISDGVLYAAKRIDVTELILKGLEKEFERSQSSN